MSTRQGFFLKRCDRMLTTSTISWQKSIILGFSANFAIFIFILANTHYNSKSSLKAPYSSSSHSTYLYSRSKHLHNAIQFFTWSITKRSSVHDTVKYIGICQKIYRFMIDDHDCDCIYVKSFMICLPYLKNLLIVDNFRHLEVTMLVFKYFVIVNWWCCRTQQTSLMENV